MKKTIAQAVILVAAGIVLALVSNAVASRERKLVLPGYYPNATQVPMHATEPAPQPVAPPTATATTPAVTPVAPATTTVAPATTATAPAIPKPVAPKPKTAPRPVDVAARFKPHPDKAYIEVAYDDAAALHSSGALVLDARRTSVYEQGHIAGARPFSVWESDVDDKVNKLYEERSDPRDQLKPILIYCSGGDCEDSHMLAQKLWGIQFNNIYVYKDGYPDWVKRGGAIRTGTNP